MRIPTKIALLLAALCLCTSARAQELRDGAAVLRAMHDRYANNWYQTLTFKQESVTHKPDGTNSSEIWYESLLLPGNLRIDMGQPNSPNGMLVADGKLIRFKNNEITATRPFVHMLLVLGFDVYRQPVQTTVSQVKAQGFDLSKLYEVSWEGHPVYVVGADQGDLKSKQFWIDKDTLLFVRMLEPDDRDPSKLADSRFTDYRQLSVGWVAARVEFFSDGKNVFSEIYSDIKANPKLDPAIFSPSQFKPQPEKPQN
jgi:outer membrane lipoprotein-sorting protein